jgi:hypothetical protein
VLRTYVTRQFYSVHEFGMKWNAMHTT